MSLMKMPILNITVWGLLHSRDVHGWLGPVTNSDLILHETRHASAGAFLHAAFHKE